MICLRKSAMHCRSLLFFAVLLVGFMVAAGQESTFTSVDVPTIDQLLQKHGIALTKGSVLEALQNRNSEVRWLAAQKLADEKATDAIPQIIEALNNEKSFKSELNIAYALAQLADGKGFTSLKTICGNQRSPYWGRLLAAEYMLELDNDGCLDEVLGLLQSDSTDSTYRIKALSLLPRFSGISQENSDRILNIAIRFLTSTDIAVRIEATEILAQIGNKLAMPYLQDALNREQSKIVSSSMTEALKRLAKAP